MGSRHSDRGSFVPLALAFGAVLAGSAGRTAMATCPDAPSCAPQWCADLPGLNGEVNALVVFNGELYAGGKFTLAGNVDVRHIARWDGQSWHDVGGGLFNGNAANDGGVVYALAVYQDRLYAGGDFAWAGDFTQPLANGQVATRVTSIAAFDGVGWSKLTPGAEPGLLGVVYTMLAHDGSLFIGGQFYDVMLDADAFDPNLRWLQDVNHIVRYSGGGFSRAGGGVADCPCGTAIAPLVRTLASAPGGPLYVGGLFDIDGPVDSGRMARCAAGDFGGLATWDGSSWQAVGDGGPYLGLVYCSTQVGYLKRGGVVHAISLSGPERDEAGTIYVGGGFAFAGSEPVFNVAKLSPSTGWRGLYDGTETGVSDTVYAFANYSDYTAFAPRLYIGGHFQFSAAGTTLNNATAWDGVSLKPLTGPNAVGTDGRVQALAVHSESDGEVLYAGGLFQEAGGLSAGRIARWFVPKDHDGDRVPERCDNCPGLNNPAQIDSDYDDVGDECDVCPLGKDSIDSDQDGLPDACDNCSDIANGNQADLDLDGIGDVCRPIVGEWKIQSVRDLSGSVLEWFEYEGGRLSRRCRGPSCASPQTILRTTYSYDGAKLEAMTHQPLDGSAQARQVELVYSETDPMKVIGTRVSGCACSNGETFTYRDLRGRVTRIAAPTDLTGATVDIEQIDYVEQQVDAQTHRIVDENQDGVIDDRILEIRRRIADGPLVAVERRAFSGGPRGAYSVRICRRVDSATEEVRRESYDSSGRLTEIGEFKDPKASGWCLSPDTGVPADYVTQYEYERTFTAAGAISSETTRVRSPAGYTDVSLWSITGTPNAAGSIRTRRSFRQSESDGVLDRGIETDVYDGSLGGYRRQSLQEPGGASTTYTYYPGFPDRVDTEVRTPPLGLTTFGSLTTKYYYDADGRPYLQVRPGPSWSGSQACAVGVAGCVATVYHFDYFGRQTEVTSDSGGAERTTLTRHNAFDEVLATYDPAHLLRASHYNNRGQREYEYTCGYDGPFPPLSPWDASAAPTGCDLLSETLYTYHPLSAKVMQTRVVLADVVPFALSTNPTQTADTASEYDTLTGRWLQVSGVAGLVPTTYDYDDQGRVKRSTTGTGIASDTIRDGRGLIRSVKTWNPATGPSPALVTSHEHGADGQLHATIDSALVRTDYGYSGLGQRQTVLRCRESNGACAGPILSRTEMEYDTANNLVRQYVVDANDAGLSDTATDYDMWNRPFRVRRRVHFNESSPIDDDIVADDGLADEVTLTVYDPAGLVKQTARKAADGYLSVDLMLDTITEHVYNPLGEPLLTKRPAESLDGQDITSFTQFVRDSSGRVTRKLLCENAPDANGDCSPGDASVWDYDYDAAGRVVKEIDPEGHYVDSLYDSRGHLNRQVAYEQLVAGDRTGENGVAKSQRRWKYDTAGRLWQTVEVFDPSAATTTEPNVDFDRVTDFAYDDDGRLTSKTVYGAFGPEPGAFPVTTVFGFDPLGRPESVTDGLGNVRTTEYHPTTGLVDRIVANDGLEATLGPKITTLHYDLFGRAQYEIVGEGEPDPVVTERAYDALDRVIGVIVSSGAPEGTSFETDFDFDLAGRLLAVTEAPGGGVERITGRTYDRLGRLKSITGYDADPGASMTYAQTTSYEYDRQGRLVRASYPRLQGEVSTVENDYDRLGRLIERRDFQGRPSLYTYDRRGLLTIRTLCSWTPCGGGNDSPVDTFAYDGLARMTSARRDARSGGGPLVTQSTAAYTYDAFSNAKTQTQNLLGGGVLSQSFDYDQLGHRVQSNCPYVSGAFLPCLKSYYDPLGRLFYLIRNGVSLAEYDATNGGFGEHLDLRTLFLASFTETLEARPTYDAHRREALLENRRNSGAGATLLSSFGSTFDVAGNRTDGIVTGDPALSETTDNVYSPLQQLRFSSHSGGRFDGSEQFLTDRLGNRNSISDTRLGVDLSLAYGSNYDANEYPWIGSSDKTLQYDASGNLNRDERGRTFVYDLENHLVEVKDATGKSLATWSYDALGRRVSEGRGGKTTYFYYDGDRVVAEYEKSGSTSVPRRYFIDGPRYVDEHLLMRERDATGAEADFFYVQDPMYSVSALVDAGGRVVETYRYDAFGGLTFTPKVEPVGGKYLRITLPPGESGSSSEKKVRIRVRPDCAGSTWKYVRPPAVNPRNGAGWAALVADNCQGSACDPGETTAGMAGYGGWGPVVYVTGAEIVPGKRYVVEVEHRLDGVTVATQTARTSWPTGRWGDTDGNGTVNFLDVSRIVAAFQGSALTSSDNSAFYAADLVGGTCAANNLINFQDTGAAVKAFQRQGEPYSEVTSCAEPACTGCTESSCAGPIVIPHNPYRFQGQRLDFDLRLGKALPWAPNSPENGQPDLTLYHFRARAFEARQGRFLQRDPLEFHDGMNPYEAFKGNPLRYLDPEGRETVRIAGDRVAYESAEFSWDFATIVDGKVAVIDHPQSRFAFAMTPQDAVAAFDQPFYSSDFGSVGDILAHAASLARQSASASTIRAVYDKGEPSKGWQDPGSVAGEPEFGQLASVGLSRQVGDAGKLTATAYTAATTALTLPAGAGAAVIDAGSAAVEAVRNRSGIAVGVMVVTATVCGLSAELRFADDAVRDASALGRGGIGPVNAGRNFEIAAGVSGPKKRVVSALDPDKYRYPDALTKYALEEAKARKYVTLTPQLKDYLRMAEREKVPFVLKVLPDTRLSGSVQDLVDNKTIQLVRISP